MDAYKPQCDSKLDLSLYLEGLFQREEPELEISTQALIETEAKVEYEDIELSGIDKNSRCQ